MAVSPRLEVRQTQQLAMTQELRQAIGLLRLTTHELQEFVENEVHSNPFLELEPQRSESLDARPFRDVSRGLGSPDGPEQAAPDLNLTDSLLAQLRMVDADPTTLAIAMRLATELDEDGWLRIDLREISLALEQPLDRVRGALKLVQACEPTGVGARTMVECFGLQLREMGELNKLSTNVLMKLNQISQRGIESVAREIGASLAEVEAVMMLVRTLDRAPGLSVRPEPVQMATPDIAVARDNLGGWSVELMRDYQPRVQFNELIAKRTSQAGDAAAEYVSRHTRRANWLMRSLEQRGKTILRVATEIVRVQSGFFDGGPSQLQPLTLKDVATKLNVHESTVSRVTRGKYLVCERGSYELKYFFSKAITGLDGQGDWSALAVRDRIRQLIAEEGVGRPLSDDAIAGALKKEGVEIARRTVAKYREGMRIPSSHTRRRQRHKETSILVKTGSARR